MIKNNINNNDYLMIKGSNSTGLNKITNDIKTGKLMLYSLILELIDQYHFLMFLSILLLELD